MQIVAWLSLTVLSVALGASVVQYLTVHPMQMSRYLLASASLFFLALLLLVTQFGWPLIVVAFGVGILAFLVGYTVMTRRFLAREDERPVPAIVRARDDPGQGHTAIIYFTHGEPETFDPIGWINQFREFDHQGIAFAPLLVRPIFVYKVRQKYLRVGASGHRRMHEQMIKSLEACYRQAGDHTTKFYICFLDDNPRPDAAVIQALNDGASRIIVAEVFLTISNHTAEGKALIEEIGIDQYRVELAYTGPMWDSEMLKDMYVQRANKHLNGITKTETAVLLVGHGQPDEWDQEWPTLTEQEISFRQDILDRFVADGYLHDNLGLAWMMFKQPAPGPMIEQWAARGIKPVFFIPAAISAEAIHSQADIPELVEAARVPPDFPRINLGPWNNDPMTIAAIKAKIDAQLTA